jgi:GNAT superfamily N-acetyltransferase
MQSQNYARGNVSSNVDFLLQNGEHRSIPAPFSSQRRSSSKVTVAPLCQRDLPQVYHLYEEVFGPIWTERFRARWRWSQEENLYPASTHQWVLKDAEQVVGFLGTVPIPYILNGQRVMAHTPCDYMVHPGYRFHGIALLREFFSTCENCVTCDDIPTTIKVTKWFGAQDVGILVRYAKLLDCRALGSRKGWRWVPSPLLWLSTQLFWAGNRSRTRENPALPSLEMPVEFDWRFEQFFQKMSSQVPFMVAKDLSFLQWRYSPASPHATRELAVATDGNGTMIGYVVIYASKDVGHQGQIFDLQVLPGHRKAADLLLGHAIRRLRAQGAWVVYYHCLSSPFTIPSETLEEMGFKARGGHRVLVKFRDQQKSEVAQHQQNWNYSFGDSEASHGVT